MTAASASHQPKAPAWIRTLLSLGAENLAGQWNARAASVTFKGPPHFADTFRISLVADVVTSTFRLAVHHKDTGAFVCQSLPVVMDELDASSFTLDF